MFEIFKKRQQTPEPSKRYISDILVNDVDGEAQLGVQDYTRNPSDFLIDLHQFQKSHEPLIKIVGSIASLRTRPFTGEAGNYDALYYEGFLVVNGDFPLHFSVIRDSKEEVPNLKLEEMMLETARTLPIVMTGRLRFDLPGHPYSLVPLVLKLGEYISPEPRKR